MSCRQRRSEAGHTLLELLLVLSIIGVLFTLLIPAVNRLYQRFELDTASHLVTTELRRAQVSARVHGDEHEVRFNRFTPRYTLWEQGVFLQQQQLPSRVAYRLGYIENAVATLVFGPTRATGSGSIRLVNGVGQQADIKIYPVSGHIAHDGVLP
ncbi:prepilin-type N-terminal cleavage/methylation domain-containing protein [Tumebacillus sp. BK434]|uniref:prepilin-type N-terminal cleavage/methylation domain-containing protein n=1 Tax=Tumebacillus sp. BK434 TaxID=2512169 RepID=UPI00104EC983|nr:prepilin-type N-terminal cleavage/methylation domain-containing protein [Tumebacillus sp. BK434]TCP59648.1 prepilin-type N-terminal cleavage/methylation domain-containing protein [Tumebacillus sp. BK434]